MITRLWFSALSLAIAATIGPSLVQMDARATSAKMGVRIVRPVAGQEVDAGERFKIRLRIRPRDFSGHIHIYVDNKLRKMVFRKTTKIKVSKGKHTIKAELVGEMHQPIEGARSDRVRVVAR